MNQATDYFDIFPKAVMSDWVKAAEKELNGKPLGSLNYPYNNENIMTPVVFPGINDKKMKPIVWRKNQACQRGISFNQLDGIKEKDIETFISMGVKDFKLNVRKDNNFKAEKLKKSFPLCQWLVVYEENRNSSAFFLSDNMYFKSEENNPINQILDNFQLAIRLIQHVGKSEEHNYEFLGNIKFSREINANYLYEISLGRAQRIVWRNILQAFKIENPAPSLFISTLPAVKNGLHDHFLVEATAKTLSAVLGGADLIYIEFDEVTTKMRAENLAHIHNIFAMESELSEIIDPIAGSFYLDELTTKLAKQIWSRLKS